MARKLRRRVSKYKWIRHNHCDSFHLRYLRSGKRFEAVKHTSIIERGITKVVMTTPRVGVFAPRWKARNNI